MGDLAMVMALMADEADWGDFLDTLDKPQLLLLCLWTFLATTLPLLLAPYILFFLDESRVVFQVLLF